jgi:hypothetical protein
MPEIVLCKICGKRRARRACPAVHGDICTLCCGTEREVSLSCPLVCEYLQQAHQHEKAIPVADKDISYPSVVVSESFLRSNEELLIFCAYALLQAAMRAAGAIDSDVLTALEALIQTQRTLESGLLYETRAENTIAAGIQRGFSASLEEYRKARSERDPLSAIRNSDLLTVLIFLHRLGQQNRNGRPRGRMFLDLLRHMSPEQAIEERPSSIIV